MAAPGTIPAHSHTYDDNTAGGYTVTVKVTDKDGGSDAKTFNANVHNVAPTATLNAPSPVVEGTSTFVTLPGQHDPSGADTAAGFHYAFDCDGGSDSKTFTANVANVAPTATLSNGGPIFEGSSASISFSGQHDPSGADTSAGFHYAFDCSGGSLAGATYAGSGTSASTSCSFP